MISISSDAFCDHGSPEPHLKLIADAGFKHVHWVHHWNSDFIYTPSEIKHIKSWLSKFGLALHGIHASAGQEKRWSSNVECQREAGVELVLNRIEMAAKLSTDFIVLHAPMFACDTKPLWPAIFKSLDQIMPKAMRHGVAVAIENMCNDDFAGIDMLLKRYPAEYLGICYDAGHGNIGRRDGLAMIAKRAKRVIALHIHDNNSFNDQHCLPFSSSLEWKAFAKAIAKTSCHSRINLEVICKGAQDPAVMKKFLHDAFESATKIESMVKAAKK